MKTIRQWVGGEYYEGSPLGVIPVENPATGEVTAELLQASKEDLDHTVEVARDAQKEWANYSLSKRVAIMFKMRQLVLDHQDEMARLIVEEHGKNYSDAIGEIQRGRETLDFATAINVALKGEYSHDVSTGVDIHTTRQPVGVVAGICPFNFPAMVPMWMHPLAVATGNAFILKPASPTPSASLLTAELYKEAGLPDGVFNVLSGGPPQCSGHPGSPGYRRYFVCWFDASGSHCPRHRRKPWQARPGPRRCEQPRHCHARQRSGLCCPAHLRIRFRSCW